MSMSLSHVPCPMSHVHVPCPCPCNMCMRMWTHLCRLSRSVALAISASTLAILSAVLGGRVMMHPSPLQFSHCSSITRKPYWRLTVPCAWHIMHIFTLLSCCRGSLSTPTPSADPGT